MCCDQKARAANVQSGADLPVGIGLKPRASRSKGGSSKLWCVQSQLPVYGQFDNYSSNFYVLIIHEIYFFHQFRFRVDNARIFQRISMNLNMTVGQATCNYCVDILNALVGCIHYLLNGNAC